MSNQLNPQETEHSRNPEFIQTLLTTNFTNENYDISFKKLSANAVEGVFKNKDNKEVYKSNFGLPNEHNGTIIRAETHIKIKPVSFIGFKEKEIIPHHPDFEIETDKFIDFLNDRLISVQDDRGIDKLNNPKPTGAEDINDLPID